MFEYHSINTGNPMQPTERKRSVDKSAKEPVSGKDKIRGAIGHAIPMLPFPVFEGMSQKAINGINNTMIHQKLVGKQYVYLPYDKNDNVYFVKAGNIEIGYLDESGRELGMDILGPGEFFGSIMGRNFKGGFARSIGSSLLGVIPRMDFEAILEKYPRFASRVLMAMSEKIQFLEEKLQNLVFNDVRTRICQLLESLYLKVGDKSSGQIRIPLTHQDVANLVASSRETASLHLSELRRVGAISYERKKIRILSLADLRASTS